MIPHDWPAVMRALQDLLEETQRDEHGAVNFIAALEAVIEGLPEEAFS